MIWWMNLRRMHWEFKGAALGSRQFFTLTCEKTAKGLVQQCHLVKTKTVFFYFGSKVYNNIYPAPFLWKNT